jgi:formate hydrogenlyase subunit 3/multisubunit Na+/H+ antiporter MnhD subunit
MATQPAPLANDDDLAKRTATTSFNIRRIFKYFVLFLCMGVILLLAVIFCGAICTDRDFRDAVSNELKDNIVGIVITGLAVIGINLGILKS